MARPQVNIYDIKRIDKQTKKIIEWLRLNFLPCIKDNIDKTKSVVATLIICRAVQQ